MLRDKGKLFSQYAVMMRCIRGNFLSTLMNVHYLENASLILSIQVNKFYYFC